MGSRAHLLITGKVQGVFYRANARDEARRLGLTGWVKNLPDGRVEAVVEGQEEQVKKLIDWCHRGPPAATVRDVDVRWEDYEGEFAGFQVRR
jgi:acylphosphatase